jgi:general secretion pathway protein F
MRADGVVLTELSETADVAMASARASDGESRFAGFDFSAIQSLFTRIPSMERATATRQLATLVGAGIPLVDSLDALVEQVEHARLSAVLASVRDRVNEGSSLADALATTGQFDHLYVSMIRAGEESGALGRVLDRIADYLEDSVRLANKVGSILIYPSVMLLFALGVVAALVTVVLPQISELLMSLDQELPWYTRAIISMSDFVRSWWWAMGALAALGFLALRLAIATERGRLIYDTLRLRLPVIGKMTRVLSISRFTRTLSTLLASGVGIVRALDIAKHVASNAVIARAVDAARTAILEGAPLAQPLRSSGEFPPLVTTMIEVGEQSGELEAMLAKVAAAYDEQVENTLARLTALLEPLLILLMVGIVLVIILATLMPLLHITSSLN